MTYCVAMLLDAGCVFLSDSRTNAGVDHIGTFRKMTIFEVPGERVMTIMTSGNLSVSQSVLQILSDRSASDGRTIWNVHSMFDAAEVVSEAIRQVYKQDGPSLNVFGVNYDIGIILGGQIHGEKCRLFMFYSAGNFIESHSENPYFQIGESTYGKPIIDRVITTQTSLDEAAKCALISMDSTLRSNISVGLPLDLMLYETDSLRVEKVVNIDENNAYFADIRKVWGLRLKQVFSSLHNPLWNADPNTPGSIATTDMPNTIRPIKHFPLQ
jgi:putative proteasome-type protease